MGLASLLLTTGCFPSLDFSEEVDYELQVVGSDHEGLEGASLQLEFRNEFSPVEGRTDSEGTFRLDRTVSPWTPTSARGVLPWLRVKVAKEGYRPLVLDLDSTQFVRRGTLFRRVECILLTKERP